MDNIEHSSDKAYRITIYIYIYIYKMPQYNTLNIKLSNSQRMVLI